tara:strand:+ start:83 stop:334 length:252 start_codon:yes stop_codon:yes gene_type:complete
MEHKQTNNVYQLIKNAPHYTGMQRLNICPLEYAREFVRTGASIDQVTRELVACNYSPCEMSKVVRAFMGLVVTEIKGIEGVGK